MTFSGISHLFVAWCCVALILLSMSSLPQTFASRTQTTRSSSFMSHHSSTSCHMIFALTWPPQTQTRRLFLVTRWGLDLELLRSLQKGSWEALMTDKVSRWCLRQGNGWVRVRYLVESGGKPQSLFPWGEVDLLTMWFGGRVVSLLDL